MPAQEGAAMAGADRVAGHHRNLSEIGHERLRRDLLNGSFFPGDKLALDALAERYGIGAVPLREALNRLTSEGLVERIGQRGFFVAPISIDGLEDLVQTRIWLETRALAESIRNATPEWEEGLVLALHRLVRTQRALASLGGEGTTEEWEERHRAFHMMLLERCGSSWLMGFCAQMMDQSIRYRNLSMVRADNATRREGAAEEHQAILDAVLDHDAPRACALLEEHYRTTLGVLRRVFEV